MSEARLLCSEEILSRLRAGCLKGLTGDMERTVAARLSAGSSQSAAERLFWSERSFRERLAHVEDIILLPLGLDRDIALIALWVGFHITCCAKQIWRLMETSAVFPAEMT